MTPAPRFEQALARAASIVDERGLLYALIGGLAVAAWGAPRSTEDIDLLARAARSDELDRALLSAGFAADWRIDRTRNAAYSERESARDGPTDTEAAA